MNEDQIKNLVQEEIKEYFRESRPGYEIISNAMDESHGQTEYCMTTDTSQGLHFYTRGHGKLHSNRSMEIISGETAKQANLGVGIRAKHGAVFIDAADGDLILRGRNIKIMTNNNDQGQIVLNATKIIDFKAPKLNLDASYIDIKATGDLNLIAGQLVGYSHATDMEFSNGDTVSLLPSLESFISSTQQFGKLFPMA
tara:strand:- start:451 stop:1041 length:591 start_codon:yes stop_codon:yes gene_type:complete